MSQSVTTMDANRAHETLGIVVNLAQGDAAEIATALESTGTSLIRVAVNAQGDVDRLRALRARVPRLRVNFLVTAYSFHPATWAGQQIALQQLHDLGVLESVEGPNEMNAFATHAPDATRALATNAEKSATFAAWAAAIHDWVRSRAPGVAVYSPTVVAFGEKAWPTVTADVSGLVTAAAFHLYPGVGQASNLTGHGDVPAFGDLPVTRGWAARAVVGRPDGPAVITETGCPGSSVPQVKGKVVDLRTQAKICLNIYMDGLALGLKRVFFYQLRDAGADVRNTGGAEQHYGFFDSAWIAKMVAVAFGRVQALLGGADAVHPPYAQTSLAVAVTGMDRSASAAGTHMVLPRADGSVLVAIWNEPAVWNPASGTPVQPAPLPIHVAWGEARHYSEYDVLQSETPVARGAGAAGVFELRGYPMFLLLH